MEKSMMRRLWVLVAGGVVLYWALTNHVVLFGWIGRLWSVVSPLVAGGAIAFILNVPVRSLERRIFRKGRKPFRRAMSILITLLCVMLGLAAVMLIVIPELVGALENLVSALPSFLDSLKLFGESMGERYPDVGFWLEELDISWTSMKSSLTGLLRDGSARLVGTTVNFASSLVGKLVQFLLAAVFSIYMLARKEHLKSQAKRALAAYLPDRHVERILHAARLVNATFSKFVSGTCTEAVILGLMFLVSMLLFRFPYALLVAALVSVSAFIPIVGAFIAAVVGMLLMLPVDPMQALWFLALFLVLQQIEGNIIYPRVVGESIGLPALWVLAAVMIGGSLFGVTGMLAGVPLAAVVHVLLGESIEARLRSKRRLEGFSGEESQEQSDG
ncbi:MAG: AI-2E family transporter [Sphaerochaetaceae bacterium]|nr:AI-2E family transporter [Sphaerochaetaceae bacterium]MDX9938419.1 AI-2E family transporter [Sphaerochaetaceae bacterium]